jgi:hypothetical protein
MRRKALLVTIAILFVAIPVSAQSKPQRSKVHCPKSWKSRTLWETADAIRTTGEVKCGSKVTVTGAPIVSRYFLYVPVRTADNKTGYLASDALDKRQTYTWREFVAGAANAMDAYARTSDPHIAWCDNHGGFQQRGTETETVQVTNSNTGMLIGTGRISHTYIVCKDGTRIKEM